VLSRACMMCLHRGVVRYWVGYFRVLVSGCWWLVGWNVFVDISLVGVCIMCRMLGSYCWCVSFNCIQFSFALYMWYFSVVFIIGLFIFIIFIVSCMAPYECLVLTICSAYPASLLLFLIPVMCSLYRVLTCLLVFPM
jgi:hypothetical protein